MLKRMSAIVLVYLLCAAAWAVLGGSLLHRTWSRDQALSREVTALWGAPQTESAPELRFEWIEDREETETVQDPATGQKKVFTRIKPVTCSRPVLLDRSDLTVALALDQRKKGLLWYATYAVDLAAEYAYVHREEREGTLVITYRFPTAQALYDNFRFEVAGAADPQAVPTTDEQGRRQVAHRVPVAPGRTVPFSLAYRSQGLDSWRYSFGEQVAQVRNFSLVMRTDFEAIDFPDGTISPTEKTEVPGGWRLRWASTNLISGFQIGMEMPRRLNPGPLAARISFFAPVSLGFFYVWMILISLMRRVDIHPMNYLFLGAAFFAFHLLFAYTVDHIDLKVAFLLSSAVSVFLVVSYLRLVAGLRFAALEAGGAQLVYLVLFSYAHFFEGFTGLIVTIGSILTLFLLMQLTGRIRWEEKLARRPASATGTA